MKMKFCHYHYEKTKHPKFYDKACELMEKAKKCAFTSQNEVDIFVYKVRKALDENKPEGHPSRLVHTRSANGGQICIRSGKLDDDIARLYYADISRFLDMTWMRRISLMSANATRKEVWCDGKMEAGCS